MQIGMLIKPLPNPLFHVVVAGFKLQYTGRQRQLLAIDIITEGFPRLGLPGIGKRPTV